MRKAALLASGVLVLFLASGRATLRQRTETLYTFHHENVLGTSLEIKVQATSEAQADAAEAAALAEFDRQSAILSAWNPQSEFSRWNRTIGQAVHVSPELFEVLNRFDRYRVETNGALDASAEAVGRLWKQGHVPAGAEIARVVAEVQRPHWTLDAENRTATHLDTTPLALNSFTKSYVVDHAAGAALEAGASAIVLNNGGDIVVRGAWSEPVSLVDPQASADNDTPLGHLVLRDSAIATSGNYRRGVDIGGKHYSHIVDPRTGRPAEEILSSTVIAPVAADAGALATAFSVLTPEESAKVAARTPGVEYMLIARNGTRIASKGFPAFYAAPPPAVTDAELTVNLEIGHPDAARYRRPFVAVWVEDKDHFPVRTIALWFDRPRWLNELKAWYHDDRMRSMAEGNDITATVASATRSPGKYSLKWDGKDNAGKDLKPGKYTVLIEAAREHGTYQIMKQEIDLGGKPQKFDLGTGSEIASASLDYHKR